MNVHECSLTIFCGYGYSWTSSVSWTMFMNNPCSSTKWEFTNRIIFWTHELSCLICCSRIFMNRSWTRSWTTVHEHVYERSWTFIVVCPRTFMNYSWMFMSSSWSSHRRRCEQMRTHLFIARGDLLLNFLMYNQHHSVFIHFITYPWYYPVYWTSPICAYTCW